MMTRSLCAILVAVLLPAMVLAPACGRGPGDGVGTSEQPAVAGPANQDLDISLASLPDDFTVAKNEGDELVLVPADPQREGSLVFSVGPVTRGINLVAAVDQHRARIAHLPQGHYLGRTELGGRLGVSFLSRGRFEENGVEMEQVCLFVIHPNTLRRLDLTYTYPAGDDSSKRAQQLLNVFAEVDVCSAPTP